MLLCLILGFSDIKTTLFSKVKKAYKVPLANILAKSSNQTENYHGSKAVYISEAGLYQLIFSSRLVPIGRTKGVAEPRAFTAMGIISDSLLTLR